MYSSDQGFMFILLNDFLKGLDCRFIADLRNQVNIL